MPQSFRNPPVLLFLKERQLHGVLAYLSTSRTLRLGTHRLFSAYSHNRPTECRAMSWMDSVDYKAYTRESYSITMEAVVTYILDT